MSDKQRVKADLQALGAVIQSLRKARDWTQTDLAKKLGRSTGLISKIESGQHPLDYGTLSKIANVLDTTSVELVWKIQREKLSKNSELVTTMDRLIANIKGV